MMMMKPSINDITNDEWISGLTADCNDITDALGRRIRDGLGAALAHRADVSEADLDDFTQEAVMRILQRLDTFLGDSRFTTWAMAVAVRESLTTLRRRQWQTEPIEEQLHALAAPDWTFDQPADTDTRGQLLAALRMSILEDLTASQRQVLLGELNGVPQVVMADWLSVTPNAIYKNSYDARKTLKTTLERRGFDARTIKEVLAKRA
ncbi:MAG: RNA polymerase sigma factor [Planctomycetota bacterium]|jgi:RNA polymerase sigma-70 factor (ECF subfamily)